MLYRTSPIFFSKVVTTPFALSGKTLEAQVGEMVELEFTLGPRPVTIFAMVRQKNAFRYGFEFVDSNANEVIRIACRQLAIGRNSRGDHDIVVVSRLLQPIA